MTEHSTENARVAPMLCCSHLACQRHVADLIAQAVAERERELYVLRNKLAIPACRCPEGPYIGTQMIGTPLRCERCGKEEPAE